MNDRELIKQLQSLRAIKMDAREKDEIKARLFAALDTSAEPRGTMRGITLKFLLRPYMAGSFAAAVVVIALAAGNVFLSNPAQAPNTVEIQARNNAEQYAEQTQNGAEEERSALISQKQNTNTDPAVPGTAGSGVESPNQHKSAPRGEARTNIMNNANSHNDFTRMLRAKIAEQLPSCGEKLAGEANAALDDGDVISAYLLALRCDTSAE